MQDALTPRMQGNALTSSLSGILQMPQVLATNFFRCRCQGHSVGNNCFIFIL